MADVARLHELYDFDKGDKAADEKLKKNNKLKIK